MMEEIDCMILNLDDIKVELYRREKKIKDTILQKTEANVSDFNREDWKVEVIRQGFILIFLNGRLSFDTLQHLNNYFGTYNLFLEDIFDCSFRNDTQKGIQMTFLYDGDRND